MSRYGLGLMSDFEDDPFFGSHMRQMNQMMNSMFADPFGLMGPQALTNEHHQQARMNSMSGMQMIPFGFPMMPSLPMGRMFPALGNMSQDPNCHSFTSSSIMTMTSSGPDGRPQVYQETMSTRSVPGGVKETKQTVSDSRTGTRKMAIGHHIGERAHILEREHNLHSGEQEERQEFINLDEEEADAFNYEWQTRTKRSPGAAIAGSSQRSCNPYHRSHQENGLLALPSTVPPSSQQSESQSRPIARPRRSIRSAQSSRPHNTKISSRSSEKSGSSSTSIDSKMTPSSSAVVTELSAECQSQDLASTTSCITSPSAGRSKSSRKREHSPEPTPHEVFAANKRVSSQSQLSSTKEPIIPCIDVTD